VSPRRSLAALAVALFAWGASACADLWGEDTLSTPGSLGTDSGPGAEGGSPSPDGGDRADGGGGQGAPCVGFTLSPCDAGMSEPYSGTVYFEYAPPQIAGEEAGTFSTNASFVSSQAMGTFGLTCSSPLTGKCCLIDLPSGSPPPQTSLSAGPISISDGADPIGIRDYDTDNYGGSSSLRWKPHDTLGAQANGDTIAGFSGSIVAPAPVAGLTPAFTTSGTPVVLPTTVDLRVSWTPDDVAGSQILLEVTASPSAIVCLTDDGDGAITIDAGLLGALKDASKGGAVSILALRAVQKRVASSNAVVLLSGYTTVEGSATF